MFRQTYEIRENDTAAQKQMELRHIASQGKINRSQSSFAGNGKMTQERYEKNMSIVTKASRSWL